MERIPDEILMAYADGALADGERRRVEAALEGDAGLRARLEPYVVTRDALPSLFSEALTSAVPDRLVDTVLTAPIGTRSSPAQIRNSAPLMARLREALFPQMPGFAGALALATGVAMLTGTGFLAGRLTQGPASSLQTMAAIDDDAIAAGPLKIALDTVASKTALESGLVKVTPVLTFRNTAGRYCRQYTLARAGKDQMAGYACRRSDGRWSVAFHAPASELGAEGQPVPPPAGSTDYAPADSPEFKVLERAIDKVVAGDVLARKAEAQLIADGWQD